MRKRTQENTKNKKSVMTSEYKRKRAKKTKGVREKK